MNHGSLERRAALSLPPATQDGQAFRRSSGATATSTTTPILVRLVSKPASILRSHSEAHGTFIIKAVWCLSIKLGLRYTIVTSQGTIVLHVAYHHRAGGTVFGVIVPEIVIHVFPIGGAWRVAPLIDISGLRIISTNTVATAIELLIEAVGLIGAVGVCSGR